MRTLTRSSQELFRRRPDECFPSLDALSAHCQMEKEQSVDRWHPPDAIALQSQDDRLSLTLGTDGAFLPNHWSFSQLCAIAGVSRDTINRLCPDTATLALRETFPRGGKPLQVLTLDERIRSVHGTTYTRLYNVDLVASLRDAAEGFEPPQKAETGGTGLYCGEQDLFSFLIDPTGWVEINEEAFAPGFFVWNSEVGKRSVGIQTFWFQAVCANHIVWDAVEVVDFKRRHTANVHESLDFIRDHIQALVAKRDTRRDAFAGVIHKAMATRLGDDAEAVQKLLAQNGIPRGLAKEALKVAQEQGRFTIFAVVDALTRLAAKMPNAGDRTEADQKVSSLLALAA